MGLVVTTDDDAGDVLGDVDRRRTRERLLGVGVQQVTPTQLGPVQALDLPPVRVAVLAGVVVVPCDVEADPVPDPFDGDSHDVRFSKVE